MAKRDKGGNRCGIQHNAFEFTRWGKFAKNPDVGLIAEQAFGHCFGVTLADHHPNAGISFAELGKDFQHVHRAVCHDVQVASAGSAAFDQKFARLFFAVKQPPGNLQQFFARRGYLDLLFMPVEQKDIIFLFQLPDLIGNRRLGQDKLLGRARKSSENRNIVKGAKLDISHISRSL